jgi:hypothetical protein
VIDKPGKGGFHATALQATLQRLRRHASCLRRRDHRGVRADDHARGQRPRLRLPAASRTATASYFPQFKAAAIEMIVAQGGIVGWAAPLRAALDALAAAGTPTPAGARP